ncbi:MAG: hypothetical protein QOH57_4040 [Mycobacterium sp.]|jgi:hypothetical protein|nr:hypothetical protein [Mycobacterium sp.]
MTYYDRAAARREITDALVNALERRHEVLDAIVEAESRADAVEAISALLGTSTEGGEAVMGLSFDRLTKDSRRRIGAELENLNKQLSFTLGKQPAEGLTLRPFAGESDRDVFATRTEDINAAGDGSGGPAGALEDEIRSGMGRINAEDAVWLVAEVENDKVGMVFGELAGHEVNVRVWVHPGHRGKGYGTAALGQARMEMAAYFPAVPLVIRAPAAT